MTYAVIWIAVVLAVIIALSVFAHVPYLLSILGFSAWAAFGHLITLDDDEPGGWSNPEGSRAFWRSSLRELAIKFAVLVALICLAVTYPILLQYGR